VKFSLPLRLALAAAAPLFAFVFVAPVAAKPVAKQASKNVQVAPISSWRCLDGGSGCEGQFGFMIKEGEPESWGPLTLGDGSAGIPVAFNRNEILAGNLAVARDSIVLVRRYNMSDFRRTINGVPSKLLIRYQFIFRDQGRLRGFVVDATNVTTMRDFDLRLSSWSPTLTVVDNDPWFFGG